MKNVAFVFTVILCATTMTARACCDNPFTGNHENQIAFNIGTGVNGGFLIPPPSQFVPFFMLPNIQYSQPTTFFKMPARQSLNFGETVGMGKRYGWDWRAFTIPMAWASGDVALIDYNGFYFGPGVGVGFQAQQNKRLGAKLVFQFKLTAGYRLTDNWGMELFVQHFSNGNTAPENNSYGFYGAGLTYNF